MTRILDCHLMSGSADYLLRIVATDLEHYDWVHRNCLSRLPGRILDAIKLFDPADQEVAGLSRAARMNS